MNWEIPDVDLDVKDREKVVRLFPEAIVASQLTDNSELVKHKSGVYFQNAPVDPVTGFCSFPYDFAEDFGYYKVDLLPNHVYDDIGSEQELVDLLEIAENPDAFPWDWFLDERFYNSEDTKYQITQLSKHYKLCTKYPPHSVDDLAVLIALIRPQKKYLVGKDWEFIKSVVWTKQEKEEGYFFKKSHAVAFALAILVHMMVISQKLGIIE